LRHRFIGYAVFVLLIAAFVNEAALAASHLSVLGNFAEVRYLRKASRTETL
jgi:hypothetical protein